MLLVGSRTAVAVIDKFNSFILLFVKGEIYCRSYGRDEQWFHLDKDLEHWIKGLPKEGDLTKYLSSINEEGYEKALDSIKELFNCIEEYKRGSEDLERCNQLPTERLHLEDHSSIFSMLRKGTGKDFPGIPFSWGTDMQGKLLVASVAKSFLKENWKDKAVYFRGTFRREAPNEKTFFKGDINIEDVLTDQAPLVFLNFSIYVSL
jgi:hypothetical protein